MLKFVEHVNLVLAFLSISALAVVLGGFFRETPGEPTPAAVRRMTLALVGAGWIAFPFAFLLPEAPDSHVARVVGFAIGVSVAGVSSGWGARLERQAAEAGAPTTPRAALRRIALFFPMAAGAAFLVSECGPRIPVGILGIGAVCALGAFAAGRGKGRSAALRITCFAGASAALTLLVYSGFARGVPRAVASGVATGACVAGLVLCGTAWAAAWRRAVHDAFAVAALGAGVLSALALAHLAGRV
jgi:hypothetical protein